MRLMIGGTHSGCGKTTVTLALLKALRQRGLQPAPFKSGPDYIDPGFHRRAAGRVSHNLDLFLMGEKGLSDVLSLGLRGADVGIIEGAMSFYDGLGGGTYGSSHDLARKTGTPAILVVDASGSAAGAAATALGFQLYRQPNQIAAVLVNRASSQRHYEMIRDAVAQRTGLPCVGWMQKDASVRLESRHLGLIPAEELAGFDGTLDRLASLLHIDWERLMSISKAAKPVKEETVAPQRSYAGFRMGVALDAAFSFYYEANLEMLRRTGMCIVPFSPLNDAALPQKLDGLYLGGGFPEVFSRRLSENQTMLASLKQAILSGLPTYAECGGMMALGRDIDGVPMAGVLPISFRMTRRLQRFGYVCVTDRNSGITFPAHEFHHSLEEGDGSPKTAFDIVKASDGTNRWTGGYRMGRLLAGYPHIHFWDRPELISLLWAR